VDETYVGGRKRGARGRSHEKDIVIGIRQRGGQLRFIKAEDVTQGTLYDIINANVDKTVDVIVTDEFASYNFNETQFRGKHKTIKHKAGIYVQGDIYTNTVESAFSLLKRGIMGTWHRLSTKHLPAYLNEMTFRFNRRKNHDLFFDTLRHMITAPVLTFEKLTA
jgi:transposase-like protein